MISKIVFFGDSITAASRSPEMPLGNGYVAILKDHFSSDIDLNGIQFINSGVNGNVIGDLLKRYHTDLLDHSPEAVVMMIGINDAYSDFHAGNMGDQIQIYEAGLDKLISALHNDLPLAQFFLFTPYLISDSSSDAFYLKMKAYCGVVKTLGNKFSIPVLDIQAVFDSAVKSKPAKEWADDQIHPHQEGHALIAETVFPTLKRHILDH